MEQSILSHWPYFAAPLFLIWGAGAIILFYRRSTSTDAAHASDPGAASPGARTTEHTKEDKEKLLRAFALNPLLFFLPKTDVSAEEIQKKAESIIEQVRRDATTTRQSGVSSHDSATVVRGNFSRSFVLWWSAVFFIGSSLGFLGLAGVL